MHPITVQATPQSVQITFDKAIVPMDMLLELLERLRVEYLVNEIDFSEDMLEIGQDIKRTWWQQQKHAFLKGTIYEDRC